MLVVDFLFKRVYLVLNHLINLHVKLNHRHRNVKNAFKLQVLDLSK